MPIQSAQDAPARVSLSEHLQTVTEALAAAHRQDDVFGIVLTPALEALAAVAGVILLVDAAGTRLEVAATRGHEEGAQTLWQDGPLDDTTPAGYVLESREGLFFEHAGDLKRAFPDLEARTGAVAAVASAVLPMVLDERPLGALVLDFSEPHDFSAEERRFLRTLAAQCAVALGRAGLTADLERRVAERTRQIGEDARAQAAFVAFTEAVGTQTNVLALAQQALGVLRAHFPDGSAAYYERDGDLWKARVWSEDVRADVVAVATAGLPDSSPMLAPVLHARQPVFTDVWRPEWDRPGHVRDHTTLYGTLGNYPLLIGGEVRGILSIGLKTTRQWSERNQALVRAVGRGLNLALERAEQARQLEEERAALEAFTAFSEAVGTETDVLALTRQALDVLQSRFRENSLFVYYEREDDLWKPRAWTENLGSQPELWATLQAGLPLNTPLFAQAARTGQPVFTESWEPEREQITHSQAYGAGASYPLLVGGEVRAMLSAGLRGTQHWQKLDRALIRAVGRSLDLALERAEQAQRLAAQNAELGARTRALEGFADLTRNLSLEADRYALIRRAEEVVMSLLPSGYALYYEREDGLWRNKVQTGELGTMPAQAAALQAVVDAGFPYDVPHSLVVPWTTGRPYYQDEYLRGSDTDKALVQHVSTVASLPVVVNGEGAGVLAFVLFGARRWTAVDRAVMETVVHHLGLALERTEAVAQLAQRTGELDRERTFLRAVLESLREGIVACDPDGKLTLFNDAARDFHGQSASPLPPEEWAGQYDLFEGDGTTPLQTERIPLFRAWRGERVRDAEMVIRPRVGAARSLVASGQPIFGGDGVPLGAVVAMHDVTERKQAEEALLRVNEDLRRSNGELEQFAYIASHDLQAPIRAVTSFAGVIARKYGQHLDDRGRLYLHQIVDSGEHMKRLVDDLLAFSRVHTEQRESRPTDSGAVFDTVAGRLQAEAGAGAGAGASLSRDELPVVLADPQQLDQLLQNLIANGLKYHRKGVTPRVHVSAQRDGGQWRFAVQDNGIGIEARYYERIFEIFQRLHGREAFEGTGIGLAVCKKIVERHGGRLWLESTPGEGTTFFFTLPGAEE